MLIATRNSLYILFKTTNAWLGYGPLIISYILKNDLTILVKAGPHGGRDWVLNTFPSPYLNSKLKVGLLDPYIEVRSDFWTQTRWWISFSTLLVSGVHLGLYLGWFTWSYRSHIMSLTMVMKVFVERIMFFLGR